MAAMTPDAIQGLGEVVTVVVVSAMTAVVGYVRGLKGTKPKTATLDRAPCDKHPEFAVDIARIPEISSDVKTLGRDFKDLHNKFDDRWDRFSTEVWSVIRGMEREIAAIRSRCASHTGPSSFKVEL